MSQTAHYTRFKEDHPDHIKALAAQIGALPEATHWDLIENLKGVLGASAANESSDADGDQEEAILSAELWVTDNCSGGGIEEDVAMALWLYDLVDGELFLRRRKVSSVDCATFVVGIGTDHFSLGTE